METFVNNRRVETVREAFEQARSGDRLKIKAGPFKAYVSCIKGETHGLSGWQD